MQIDDERAGTGNDELAAALAALGEPTRLRLLALLMVFGEPLCVCELSSGLGLPEYQTSRHLAALKRTGLVACEKQGLWAYYRLTDNPRFRFLRSAVRADPEDLGRMQSRLQQRVSGLCVVGPVRAPGDEHVPAGPRAAARACARRQHTRSDLVESSAGKGE